MFLLLIYCSCSAFTRTTGRQARFVIFLKLRNQGFSCQHQPGDRRGVLQGAARYLGGINDTRSYEIFKLLRYDVVADVRVLFGANSLDDHRAFFARVSDDLSERLFQRALDDVDANLLVRVARRFVFIRRV